MKPENIVCAILLAILGVASFFFGGFVAGGAAIAGAIALVVTAGTIDWDKFRCDLAWYRLYLFNGLRALHDVLALGALVHPYKNELAEDQTTFQLLQGIDPTIVRTGDNVVMSRPTEKRFPHVPWSGSGFSWFDRPDGEIEEPGTFAIRTAAYPSGFIDDPANPFGSASVFDPVAFPFTPEGPNPDVPVGFRNAVDAVAAWLLTGAKSRTEISTAIAAKASPVGSSSTTLGPTRSSSRRKTDMGKQPTKRHNDDYFSKQWAELQEREKAGAEEYRRKWLIWQKRNEGRLHYTPWLAVPAHQTDCGLRPLPSGTPYWASPFIGVNSPDPRASRWPAQRIKWSRGCLTWAR